MKILKFILLFFPITTIGQQQFEAVREKTKSDNNYEYIYGFENGYAVFRTFNSKMGMIDSTGNVIIKPVFNYIHNNKNLKKIFEVGNQTSKGYKRGFIDLQGNIKIPIVYDDVFYLEEGLIRATINNKRGILDTANKVILPNTFDDISMDNGILIAEEKGIYQLYDANGKKITDSKFTDVSNFMYSKAIVSAQNTDNFVLDSKGKAVVAPIKNHTFEKILNGDLYLIRQNQTLKKGIVDASGHLKIDCRYDEIAQSGSVFIVEHLNRKGIVAANDALLKPIVYDDIFYYAVEDAVYMGGTTLGANYIARKDKLYGVINPFLQSDVLPFSYQSIVAFQEKYYVARNTENKSGVFYKDGFKITEEEYEFYNRFENKIFASKDNKPYLITLKDTTFTEVKLPIEALVQHTEALFDAIHPNQICKIQDKFGVVNINGEIVVPCEYQKIENIFHSNQFIAMKNNKFGVINDHNKIILPIEYDDFKKLKEQIIFTKNKKTIKKYHPISFRYKAY
ncbi:MAG: WG repeat-containing protein [Flavobacterium sp.]|nr:MAG: WG repeat-containing protein [Flavobacterium sp.]